MKLRPDLDAFFEDNGWSANVDEYSNGLFLRLQQSTPAGEDWNETFCGQTVEEIRDSISERAANFDADEEASIWIENRDSVSGVPSSVKTLIEDAEWKDKELQDLASKFSDAFGHLEDAPCYIEDDMEMDSAYIGDGSYIYEHHQKAREWADKTFKNDADIIRKYMNSYATVEEALDFIGISDACDFWFGQFAHEVETTINEGDIDYLKTYADRCIDKMYDSQPSSERTKSEREI